MACAKNVNLPHFFSLLGKILVLRVLPAYREKIGCFPLNPPAPKARGGYNSKCDAKTAPLSLIVRKPFFPLFLSLVFVITSFATLRFPLQTVRRHIVDYPFSVNFSKVIENKELRVENEDNPFFNIKLLSTTKKDWLLFSSKDICEWYVLSDQIKHRFSVYSHEKVFGFDCNIYCLSFKSC